ncbi:hypothetical protein [Prescottella agglutinans]|uniref:hypothetical protein n=1 Tax=Prescottella agglutinans TaxID=1644129 RepID=UPI002475DAA5|nr:hypothetical protein [Prescottella agglutinans]
MSVAPALLVAAPTITPARYGLASAADLVVEQNPRFRNGIEFEENPTGPAKLSQAECGVPQAGGVRHRYPADRGAADQSVRGLHLQRRLPD